MMIKMIVPVVMAGVIALYGLALTYFITIGFSAEAYSLFQANMHLGAGLGVGLCGLAAGLAIGIVGEAGICACAQQPRLFVPLILVLIFSEVLGIYGIIVAFMFIGKCSAPAVC